MRDYTGFRVWGLGGCIRDYLGFRVWRRVFFKQWPTLRRGLRNSRRRGGGNGRSAGFGLGFRV